MHTIDFDSNSDQWRHVGRIESVQIGGTDLGCSVASEQFVVEANGNLRDGVVSRNDQRVQEVFLGIASWFEQGDLRASDDNSFAQVLQHEGQSGSSVRHGVGAVQNDEAIESVVLALDVLGNEDPVVDGHVGRVQQRIVLVNGVDHSRFLASVGQHQKVFRLGHWEESLVVVFIVQLWVLFESLFECTSSAFVDCKGRAWCEYVSIDHGRVNSLPPLPFLHMPMVPPV